MSIKGFLIPVGAAVIAFSVVTVIVGGLLLLWGYHPESTTYVIEEVSRNSMSGDTGLRTGGEGCDSPYLTTVSDPVTGQISIKCGKLGSPNAVIDYTEGK